MGELTLTDREQARLKAMNLVLEGKVGVGEAARALALSERQVWRILKAYREEGAAVLAHGNGGRRPVNATPEAVRERVISLANGVYTGVNHSHLSELLAEREGVTLSRSTVRNILTDAGLVSHRHRRSPRYRYRRIRTPQEGMLIQMDGSHHDWLEGRGPCFTLLLAVDDATGTVPYALFREEEDTYGYFQLIGGIIGRRGVPLAVYTDRHAVFKATRPAFRSAERGGKRPQTQFARAMKELGISMILARSPQGKGRVEKMAGTFQERLVSELRLAGANTMPEAIQVLQDFLPRFNKRFGVSPSQAESAYRPVNPELNLAAVLCYHHVRKVARDNTVRYGWRTLQLLPDSTGHSFAGTGVQLREHHDGKLEVTCGGALISTRETSSKPRYFSSAQGKQDENRRNLPQWLDSILKNSTDKRLSRRSALMRLPTVHQQARWDAIQEARGRGLSLRAMAKLLGMSRKTVRRYKAAVSPPVYPSRRAASISIGSR